MNLMFAVAAAARTHPRLGFYVVAAIICFNPLVVPAADAPSGPSVQPDTNAPSGQSGWENGLGMRFKPVPNLTVWFSIWETRLQDYEAFRSATGRDWTKPPFAVSAQHPVVNVNWEDAKSFCDWLTQRERQAGRLTAKEKYRLPTDHEWSVAVGLAPERGNTPEDRMKSQIIWPWGHYWPPQTGDGNFAPELKADPFDQTSPVGSFKPNAHGLFDLAGNVWEWCDDWYNEAHVTKALRGGSCNDAQPAALLAAYRFSGTMNLYNEDMGFRVVLEKEKP